MPVTSVTLDTPNSTKNLLALLEAGVWSDEIAWQSKGKYPVIPPSDRLFIIQDNAFVDEGNR